MRRLLIEWDEDMPRVKLPRFNSLQKEREYWQTHDVFDVLGEDGWETVEPGVRRVGSVYVSRMDRRGATLRVSRDLLTRLGAKPGSRIQARVERHRIVIETK